MQFERPAEVSDAAEIGMVQSCLQWMKQADSDKHQLEQKVSRNALLHVQEIRQTSLLAWWQTLYAAWI